MKVKKVGDEQNPEKVVKAEPVYNKEIPPILTAENSGSGKKTIYYSVGGIVILIVAALLYYFMVYQKSENKISEENSIQSELKKKELELKEKELQLKETELQQNNTSRKTSDYTQQNVNQCRFPEASTRFLTSEDLMYLSKYDLKIMRNEIFARYGYIFQTEDMRDYFSRQKSWYSPRYGDVNSFLTKIEKKNIDLIKYFEK